MEGASFRCSDRPIPRRSTLAATDFMSKTKERGEDGEDEEVEARPVLLMGLEPSPSLECQNIGQNSEEIDLDRSRRAGPRSSG